MHLLQCQTNFYGVVLLDFGPDYGPTEAMMRYKQDTPSSTSRRALVALCTLLVLAVSAGAEDELTTGRAVYLAASSTSHGADGPPSGQR